ncbi:MAG: UDP-galactopyranose mutase, partial [Kiritimatiellae bacterium]|nr:UDP-galactopyranose mutase [Kiritimatiellia bacterium]
NYPEVEVPYTRIHEFKHYHPEQKDVMAIEKTVIMREYPATWKPGDEPYYPMSDTEALELAGRYQAEAAKIPDLVVGGRLGAYKYLDMDQAMAAALELKL